MLKISLIFSADYDFQIIGIVIGDSKKAWDVANAMYKNGDFEGISVDHYDVAEFSDEKEMNNWIFEQVKESKKDKKPIIDKPNYILRDGEIHVVGSHSVTLNERIRDEDLHEYCIAHREELINDLMRWISEGSKDSALMRQDMEMLMQLKDDYIFSSISTNEYISSDDSNFDETCKELIELNESL